MEAELFDAVEANNLSKVKQLIDLGVNVNIKDKYENTPLIKAAVLSYKNLVELLLINGADINEVDFDNETALMNVCRKGDSEIAKLLIMYGADLNFQSGERDYTALMLAIKYGNIETVKILVDNGAKDNMINNYDESAMVMAYRYKKDALKYMIEKGLNLNNDYSSVLIYACETEDKENIATIEYLIDKGADVNHEDKFGRTPINVAWDSDIIELLIKKDAYTNQED
jgi:ankyrin repeat protein